MLPQGRYGVGIKRGLYLPPVADYPCINTMARFSCAMECKIAIVESLSDYELSTGGLLRDSLKGKNIDVTYSRVRDLAEFLQALHNVKLESRVHGIRRILHFEIHGTASGFSLADGSSVDWSYLKSDFQEINIAQQGHLKIVMAVCEGAWLGEIISATDRSPFMNLVGCPHKVYERSIARSFPSFYSLLANGASLEDAVRELNILQHGMNPDYEILDAERMFAIAYSKYLGVNSSPEALKARANAMATMLINEGHLRPEVRAYAVNAVVSHLQQNEECDFDRFREKFFMHDIFSENMAI
ncbi:hypothetical protein [Verrucomicrobium spinosum]|uniref:hypothetical protein n=2 Tax=Verrucomicrobium spinosum TaxID=2736 RepID=UPI0004925DC0|nr:hypothetical protein [Verrucomicrobium spinosum]